MSTTPRTNAAWAKYKNGSGPHYLRSESCRLERELDVVTADRDLAEKQIEIMVSQIPDYDPKRQTPDEAILEIVSNRGNTLRDIRVQLSASQQREAGLREALEKIAKSETCADEAHGCNHPSDAQEALSAAPGSDFVRREVLESVLDRYVILVLCGDGGNWNPEKEPVVIAARAELERTKK